MLYSNTAKPSYAARRPTAQVHMVTLEQFWSHFFYALSFVFDVILCDQNSIMVNHSCKQLSTKSYHT